MTTKHCAQQQGFTLVEIMIVVAIIGLLAAIAVPSFMRARMRAQASTILGEARMLDAAKDQYALETCKSGSNAPAFGDLTPWLKAGSKLATNSGNDALGNSFTLGSISARLQVAAATKSDAVGCNGRRHVLGAVFLMRPMRKPAN
ncbi:MAG: prepilin-type N-terminal cleavage/methylation domain-containing protein [Verrucomicrobia bacterium]|nr:prepilin-type N-terminal cleavage/methylation domain-containing protein [Verrucomicrobiota bacterium]